MLKLEGVQSTVTISMEDYELLVQKSFAYELMRREVLSLLRDEKTYQVSALQKALFVASMSKEKACTGNEKEDKGNE